MNKPSSKIPKIKKKLSGFMLKEDGKISKQSMLSLGSFMSAAVIGGTLASKEAAAEHTNNIGVSYVGETATGTHQHHSSHGSHGSHSSHSSHGSHNSHSSHSSHSNSAPPDTGDDPANPTDPNPGDNPTDSGGDGTSGSTDCACACAGGACACGM